MQLEPLWWDATFRLQVPGWIGGTWGWLDLRTWYNKIILFDVCSQLMLTKQQLATSSARTTPYPYVQARIDTVSKVVWSRSQLHTESEPLVGTDLKLLRPQFPGTLQILTATETTHCSSILFYFYLLIYFIYLFIFLVLFDSRLPSWHLYFEPRCENIERHSCVREHLLSWTVTRCLGRNWMFVCFRAFPRSQFLRE